MSSHMVLLENESGHHAQAASTSRVLDIDKYFDMISDEVENKGYSLDNEYPRAEIKKLVDMFSSPNSFNGILFNEMMTKFQGQTVSLKEFFIEYFTFYEKFKISKKEMVSRIKKLKDQNNMLKNQMRESRDKTEEEKITLKVEYPKTENYGLPVKKVGFKFRGNYLDKYIKVEEGESEIELEFGNENDINDINKGEFYLSIKTIDNDLIDLCVLHPMKYNETIAETYPMNENKIKVNIIWFKNNFELMNKELAENENELQELNEKILYLNSNILNLEQIFKGKLNNNNQNSDNITLEQNNPIDAPTLNQIIGLGDKVEDYILHISGKEQIIWEDVSYWLNVILLGVLVVQFLRRFDIIELSLCFGVFGVLYDKIDLKYSYHILFAMIGNLILELIWILYYMSNWNVNILHEQTGGITLRKVVLIFAWVGFFASIMLIFAFWKYILERKIKETNTGDIDFVMQQEEKDNPQKLKSRGKRKKEKTPRLNLRYGDSSSSSRFTIRRFDEENEP